MNSPESFLYLTGAGQRLSKTDIRVEILMKPLTEEDGGELGEKHELCI